MNTLYDLIIIGAGPAGLAAGIYAARAKIKTLVIEKEEAGGKIKNTDEVVNYPGILHTSGAMLSNDMKQQAANFGAKFIKEEIVDMNLKSDIKTLTSAKGDKYKALGVIIATGAKHRKLGFEGEDEFIGKGIGYCATCDGEFYTDKDVFVIGSGYAAAEEAIYLTKFAKKVTVIAREAQFTCSKTIADKVLAHSKIEVKFNTEIVYVKGEKFITEAKFIDNKTKKTWVHKASVSDKKIGVFIFTGYHSTMGAFKNAVKLDKEVYILTDEEMHCSIEGVWAAGDVRSKRLRQLVTAVSDGAIAATVSESYIKEKKIELDLESVNDGEGGNDIQDKKLKERIANIKGIKTLVVGTLPSCKFCPPVKEAAQVIAEYNKDIVVSIIDLTNEDDIIERFELSTVPVLIINDTKVVAGSMGLEEMVAVLNEKI